MVARKPKRRSWVDAMFWRLALIGLLVLLCATSSAAQPSLSNAIPDPIEPWMSDWIRLRVTGEFPTSGYTFPSPPQLTISGGAITVEIPAARPQGVVLQVITPFEIAVDLGRLEVGTYTVTARLTIDGMLAASLKKGFTVAPNEIPLFVVSAAGYQAVVSPGSIASGFGHGLATGTQSSVVPSAVLAGASAKLTDWAGAEHQARLFFASPDQLNFLVPAAAALGNALVSVNLGSKSVGIGHVQIAEVAPAIFTANSDGKGPPAGFAVAVDGGSQTLTPLFQCAAAGRCSPAPINAPQKTSELYLVLFGTGIRRQAGRTTAFCASTPLEVTYAGEQVQYEGLDQVNLRVPIGFPQRGQMDLIIRVNGVSANPVRIDLK